VIPVHGFTHSEVQGSVTAFLWRCRVPETCSCSLPYQISYAIRPLQRGIEALPPLRRTGDFSNIAQTCCEFTVATVNTQALKEGRYDNSLLDG